MARTVAEHMVEQWRAWGVHTVFGVTGSAVFPLLEALAAATGVRYVTAHHVEGAALMASAHAKLTGELGVCVAHAGPGAAQLVGGLYDAQRDGAPVLAVTGEIAPDGWGAPDLLPGAPDGLLAHCTGWSRLAATPREVPALLLSALRFATARHEVAHLAVPAEVQAAPLPAGAPAPAAALGYLRRMPIPDEAAVSAAAAVLARARRPGVLAGRGAAGLGAAVLALAERLQAPVAASLLAKGVVPDDHPLAVGVLGEAGSAYALSAFADRDAVAVLGSTWWPEEGIIPEEAATVQIDSRPERIGARRPVTVGIAADLAAVLPPLTRLLPERPALPRLPAGKAAWLASLRWEGWEATPCHPARVMAELRQVLPDNAIVCVDTGLATLWYGGYFPARRETTLISGRWRTMGFALPAALAAKLERPELCVLALCGDGGFGMSLPEVLTAAQHGIPVTAVVLNNGTLGETAARQVLQGRPVWGTDLGNTDFAALARAAGLQGVTVRHAEEIGPAVQTALTSGRPAVVDIPTAFVPTPSLLPTGSGAAGHPPETAVPAGERLSQDQRDSPDRRSPLARL